MTRNKFPVTGNKFPVTGNKFPVAGNKFSVTGTKYSVTENKFSLTGYKFPVTRRTKNTLCHRKNILLRRKYSSCDRQNSLYSCHRNSDILDISCDKKISPSLTRSIFELKKCSFFSMGQNFARNGLVPLSLGGKHTSP